jgi:hypothetical protein
VIILPALNFIMAFIAPIRDFRFRDYLAFCGYFIVFDQPIEDWVASGM